MSRTADSMVSAMMMDLWPSMGAIVDFGVTEQNIGPYQKAIRSGKLTADQLHEHVYDSAWLTEAIGAPVDTKLDWLLTAEFDEGEKGEEDYDDKNDDDEDYYDDDFDPEAAYYKFMSEGNKYPPDPNIISFQLGATKYTLKKKDNEEFPDFSHMNPEQIRAWCFR